jgi:transglutaminase superfamily protein
VTVAAIDRPIRLARLTTRAWLGLLAFDAARLAGFANLYAWLRRCAVQRQRSRASVDEVIWSVEEACVWYVKPAACLQRSAVATWLLRRNGIAAQLVIGCRPLPFESHAWVEVAGQVVNDRPQYQRAFTVLDRV